MEHSRKKLFSSLTAKFCIEDDHITHNDDEDVDLLHSVFAFAVSCHILNSHTVAAAARHIAGCFVSYNGKL